MNSHNRFISKEVLTHKECEPIIINCLTCNDEFDTLYVVEDGRPYDYCCSIKCYKEYHSEQNIRDRKLQILLDQQIYGK